MFFCENTPTDLIRSRPGAHLETFCLFVGCSNRSGLSWVLFVGARLLDGTLHLSLSESVFFFLVAFLFLDGATSSLGRDLFLVMIPFVTAPVTYHASSQAEYSLWVEYRSTYMQTCLSKLEYRPFKLAHLYLPGFCGRHSYSG